MAPCIYVLDPLTDPRWDELASRHPRASVFHARGWLDALARTYGYEPFALTTTPGGALADGLVLCRVKTWLARRLVSLPFSDHCEPLVDTPAALSSMIEFLAGEVSRGRWRSLELRPLTAGGVWDGGPPFRAAESQRFVLHTLDLRRTADAVFKGFHPSSTQRAVRRAEREGLQYDSGRSERLLEQFYGLLRMTRRRHGLPPQPAAWFSNLAACLGDRMTVHVAAKNGRPVAAILTLAFGKSLVYKYGGSDASLHPSGGMPFLFWQVIQKAIAGGFEAFDLGRSDLDQPGLVAFKDHLGAGQAPLTYYRTPPGRPASVHAGRGARLARAVASRLPDAVLDLSGRLLYRHLG